MPNSPNDVSNGAPNGESYSINGDGTVTDKVTGLMWQQAVAPSTYTWSGAIAYCPTLTLGGHADWRLPTFIELISIVDYSVGSDGVNPTINAVAFPNTPRSGFFWSSTLAGGSSSFAAGVSFDKGTNNNQLDVTGANSVRCVR